MLVVSLVAALAFQQTPAPGGADRNCRDDNGVDRCEADSRAATLTLLGAPSIEAQAAEGAEVYRVLQINGAGREEPIIAFERRPGSSPQVVVYARNGRTLRAGVPQTVWQEVQRDGRIADRDLGPAPGADSSTVGLCLHGWLYTVELANLRGIERQLAGDRGPVRRRTMSACGDNLTARFAQKLATEAIRLLPDCDALDPDKHRNDTTRLAVCASMEGDRMAAAQLMNQIGWGRIEPRGDLPAARAWAAWMGGGWATRFRWGTEPAVRNEGGGSRYPAAQRLVELTAADPELRAYMSGFRGVSSTRVETTGAFSTETGPDDAKVYSQAPFTQVWGWQEGQQQWVLEEWIVEPLAVVR
jgi:hypothetical protein